MCVHVWVLEIRQKCMNQSGIIVITSDRFQCKIIREMDFFLFFRKTNTYTGWRNILQLPEFTRKYNRSRRGGSTKKSLSQFKRTPLHERQTHRSKTMVWCGAFLRCGSAYRLPCQSVSLSCIFIHIVVAVVVIIFTHRIAVSVRRANKTRW